MRLEPMTTKEFMVETLKFVAVIGSAYAIIAATSYEDAKLAMLHSFRNTEKVRKNLKYWAYKAYLVASLFSELEIQMQPTTHEMPS